MTPLKTIITIILLVITIVIGNTILNGWEEKPCATDMTTENGEIIYDLNCIVETANTL